MFERFTTEARGVVVRARAAARELNAPAIGTEHLLLGMLDPDGGLAGAVLRQAGLTDDQVRAAAVRATGPRERVLGEADAEALKTVGIDLDAVIRKIEESFGPEALEAAAPPPKRGLFGRGRRTGSRFSPRAKKVLGLALREAIRLGHDYIGSEHLLLGLIREGNGLAARIITDAGVSLDDLRRATLAALGKAA